MVPWIPLATVPRPLGQQNTLKSLFSEPNRGITVMVNSEGEGPLYIEWGWMVIATEEEAWTLTQD